MNTPPLRVGLVGAGRISRLHLPAYLEFDDVELVAVCDVNEDAARDVARQAGIDAVYTDVEKMVCDGNIDAVDICSAHDHHIDAVLAAAEAGKHALVEKAMGRSLDECRTMVDAADRAGTTLMVAQNLRFGTHAPSVKRAIDAGEIGAVHAVRCDGAMDMRGLLRPGEWMLDGERAGGGTIITFSTHIIDLLRWYVGEIVRVSAATRAVWDGLANGAEDYGCAVLEFENGAIGSLFSTWTASRAPAGVAYQLYGELGSIFTVPQSVEHPAEQLGRPMISAPSRDGSAGNSARGFQPIEPSELPSTSSFVNEVLHFAACCRDGVEPISSGRDNVETLKVVFAIYEAARSGGAVDVDEL